jgi:hypothetical protein
VNIDSANDARLEKRLRASAVAVLLGLVVELASLTWHSPSAFVVFVAIGGLFMAAGMILYLMTIVKKGG